eukprot:jgi/Ulvmu1/5676/UM024_0023.1
MNFPGQPIHLNRGAVLCALGSIAAIAVVLKKTLFRGSSHASAPAASKSSVKDVLAENPLLLQVALGQGIPLSELVAESGQDAGSQDVPVESGSPRAAALDIGENPAVKKADKRMHKSRLLRKMDNDVKELMREVVYLGAIAQA